MFSNIHEAWNKDPVKEMTDRLSRGEFKSEPDIVNAFKFKDHNNNLNSQSCGGNKSPATSVKDSIKSISLHDSLKLESSLSNDSRDPMLSLSTYSAPESLYAPVNFKKKHMDYDLLTSETDGLSMTDSKCSYSIKHLRKCGRCYRSLIKLVEKKIKKRIDDAVIDMKFKQLQSQHLTAAPQPAPTTVVSDSWKETLIIVFGAVITMFLIFLIVRSLWK
jgi:hypothetical protein